MQEAEPRSLWVATAPPLSPTPPLRGAVDADVAIVGGGFLGLSAALTLAEHGARVVLMEDQSFGNGASGRNTGFVVPAFRTGLGPGDVVERLGSHGATLVALVGTSGSALFDRIDALNMTADAQRTGWLQPAHTGAFAAVLQKRAAQWADHGKKLAWLDAGQAEAATGVAGYKGALFDATGGHVNPLGLVRGLARAARAAGAILHETTRVTQLTRIAKGWRAETARGHVTAQRVLIATNALGGDLAPALAASYVPVLFHQMATAPLDPAWRHRVLPGNACLSDTRRHTFALRWGPGNRLVTGGIVPVGPARMARAHHRFRARLGDFLPALPDLAPEFVWSGTIATYDDALPRYFALAPGLDALIGCNGRGVAMTHALGTAWARLACGATTAADFPLPATLPSRARLRAFASFGPSLWLGWSEFMDKRDARRA